MNKVHLACKDHQVAQDYKEKEEKKERRVILDQKEKWDIQVFPVQKVTEV